MDFNTQRKIVKKLRESGKNPLLFLPCLIARCAVVLFMSAFRAVDMALSDSKGNFLGIKRAPKAKKSPPAVPVPIPSEKGFGRVKRSRRPSLPFRPLWQRAMSLLLACAFVSMSGEITASAYSSAALKPYKADHELITAQEIKNDRSNIYEADLYSYFEANSDKALQIESGTFNGMPNLTTITLGYSEGMSVGDNNFVNLAPDSSIFIRADSKEEFEKAASQITSNEAAKIWDFKHQAYKAIPKDVSGLTAYSGVGKVILKWDNLTPEPDGYQIYTYDKNKFVKSEFITTDKAVGSDTSRRKCSVEISPQSKKANQTIYAVRARYNYKNSYDGDDTYDVTADLYSRKFTAAPEGASALSAAAPKLSTTMSNRTVTVNIETDSKYSTPSYIILFCQDEEEIGFSPRKKFMPGDLKNGVISFEDSKPFEGKSVRSYIAVAYYDVMNKNAGLSLSDFEYPDKTGNTAEYTALKSNQEDITDAVLNSPYDLKIVLSPDNKVWTLTWKAPEDTDNIDLSYDILANGKFIDNTAYTNAKISVDSINDQGRDITFSVTAKADGMTSGTPAENKVEVSKECVQFVNIKGGNEKAEIIFKPFGTNKDTVYTIWGKEVSEDSSNTMGGSTFATITLADCTANSGGTYSYILSPLTNDVKYNFWITSNDEMCNYPSVAKEVTPSQAPQPPQNIVGKGYENSAVITWDPVVKDDGSGSYADCYNVYIYKVGVSAPVNIKENLPELTYTVEKLENDVEYYAEVSAVIIVDDTPIPGPTARSNKFKPTITVDNVLNLTVTPSDKDIKISWTAVKGASEYILMRTGPDGEREIFKGKGTSFTDSNVDNKTEYFYKVKAVRNVDGKDYDGEYSSSQRGMINFSLGSVQGLTATGGDGCVILKWDKVDGADGYYVQYLKPDSDKWSTIANVGKTTFTHTGIENGVTYDYRVIPFATVNNKEESSDTYAQKVEGKAGVNLPAPPDFTVTAGDGQITLKWSAVKGAEGYNVYLVAFDGSAYLLDQVSKTTAIHANLSNNTTFSYKVCAYKYVDEEPVEGDFSVIKTATVGVELNAPTDVTAKAGKEQVSLTWKKSDGAEGYVVYAYNIASLSFTPVGIVTNTNFVHTGLVAGREYTYMIAAYKNVNGSVMYSGYSLAVTAIPQSSGSQSSGGNNGSAEAGDFRIYITGTTPFGMSNSELISAFAGKGAFNTDIDVRFTLNPDTVTAVQNVLNFYGEGIDSFLIYPMDISIYVAGTNTRATINEGQYMTLTIPVPDELLPYSEHISVVHVSDLDQLEILPSIHVNVNGVDCMQFTANSFSPYAFVVYLPEIGEDTGAGTPVTAEGTSSSGANGYSSVFSFRNTYLPAIYRRRARNKLYKIVRR